MKSLIKEFTADSSSISDIVEYSRQCMISMDINTNLLNEYQLVIEELAFKIINNASFNQKLILKVSKHFNRIKIEMNCPGKPVVLSMENPEDISGKILEEYRNYIRQSYSSGINSIVFNSSSSLDFRGFIFSLVLSVFSAFLINLMCSDIQIEYLCDHIISPILNFFAGAMQTLSTPVVFFSIAAMIIKLNWKFEHNSSLIGLFLRYIITSFIAIAIGFFAWKLLGNMFTLTDLSKYVITSENIMGNTFEDFITNLTTSNFIEIFLSKNPTSMILFAILSGLSGSIIFEGNKGDNIRAAIENFNSFFSNMLSLVYKTIPFFLYFALLKDWIEIGVEWSLHLILIILSFAPIFLMMLIIYCLQLSLGKINVINFFKNLSTCLWENFKIGSNIDAYPYNCRVLHRYTGTSINKVKEILSLGSMINMDGNCLLLSGFIFYSFYACRLNISTVSIFGIAIIIMLVSIGAPNQPGSFIIGMIFIFSYIGISSQLYDILIIIEFVLGPVSSFFNCLGDIVTLVTASKLDNKLKN